MTLYKNVKTGKTNAEWTFFGAMNYENKVNCLESFGVNKTAEYCTKQIKAVNENFKYPLKN